MSETELRTEIERLAARVKALEMMVSYRRSLMTDIDRVMTIIMQHGEIPHSRLVGLSRFVSTPARNEILRQLKEEKRVKQRIGENNAVVWTIP